MSKYLVVLEPLKTGGWRAHLPDFDGCAGEGPDGEAALDAAVKAAEDRLAQLRGLEDHLPSLSPEEIRAWARKQAIDWSSAVVTFVYL